MKTISQQKKELRSRLRAETAALQKEYCRAADEAIAREIFESEAFKRAQTVFCFVSAPAEIDTYPILRETLRRGKQLCVPLCGEDGYMEARRIETLEQLVTGRFRGIPEPCAESRAVPQGEIDLILTPCVSADRQGNRLGQGGGYYDRFLQGSRAEVLLLCRGKMLSSGLPCEAHDMPIRWLVTEEGLYDTQPAAEREP